MLTDKKILFYTPDGNLTTNGVYASQVGGLAKYCESLGAQTMIWDNGLNRKLWFFQVARHFRDLAWQNRRLVDFKPTHIYARTFYSAIAAKELARKTGAKLVYSMRGADMAEALMAHNLRALVIAVYSAISVRRALRLADHVNSVSKTMAAWIARKFGKSASVLPCCVAGTIKSDGWAEDGAVKTVVYSGGLSAWQKIDTIIGLMKKIGEADPTIRFRFLTKDVEALKRKCAAVGLGEDRWSAKACKQCEVAEELAKADCGIIIRDNTLVNQVASPIKVGEYLAAGLGVIASPFIGDVGKELADKDFACLVDESTPVEKIVAFVKGMNLEKRKHATQWAKDHLTYEGNKAAVLEMFS